MRHKKQGKILDRKKAPREMMLRNLAASIIIYEKVKTTGAKAKAVRSLVEKVISLSKGGDLSAKRKVMKILPQHLAVKKLFEVLSLRYKDKRGGYTKIIKLGRRQGDNADIVLISLT